MYSTPLMKRDHFGLEFMESNVKSVPGTNLKSEWTQTEDIYCEECGCLLQNQLNLNLSNASHFSSNVSSVVIDKSPNVHSTNYRDDSYAFADDHISQFGTTSIDSVLPSVIVNTDKISMDENNETVVNQKPNRKNSVKDLSERRVSVENALECRETSPIKAQNFTEQNKEKVIDSQQSENENYESKSTEAEPNIDSFVSKSDAESMNNEFDFLESDTKKSSKRNAKIEKSLSSDIDANIEAPSSAVEYPANLPPKQKDSITVTQSNLKMDLGDDKSETSGSVSGKHRSIEF